MPFWRREEPKEPPSERLAEALIKGATSYRRSADGLNIYYGKDVVWVSSRHAIVTRMGPGYEGMVDRVRKTVQELKIKCTEGPFNMPPQDFYRTEFEFKD